MEEKWKTIKEFKNYEVSNMGRVRSKRRMGTNGGILVAKECNGYLKVKLVDKGKRKNYRVHRLVAEAFIPNPKKLPQVNHKDENRTNNRVENLEWCTSSYNNYYKKNKKQKKTFLEKLCTILLFWKKGCKNARV